MQALRNRPWYYPDHNISTECAKGGTAQCAGFSEDGDTCDCHCHGTTEDIGQTIPEVLAWHVEYWGTTPIGADLTLPPR